VESGQSGLEEVHAGESDGVSIWRTIIVAEEDFENNLKTNV